MSEIEIKFVISLIISLIVHLTDLITVLSLLWMIAIWTPASSLIRRSPAVPHSSEGSATISRAANLIKTLPMKTVIQSQLLADYLCKDPHVCNSSVTHSTDDHHQHILHCVFWNLINGKSLWFFRLLKYARIENTHVLNAVRFPLPIYTFKKVSIGCWWICFARKTVFNLFLY